MKLIKSVEIVDSRDVARISRGDAPSSSACEDQLVREEIVNGRRFHKIVSKRNEKGEMVDEVIYDFVIGATADANGIFGIYCAEVDECFSNLEDEREYSDQLEKRNKELREQLNELNSLTFWQKLARLFA